ncbi:Tyramine beta-hydroxylase [Folsomia candida]|uniref:Tyramine beta-hydroxylase n=1 Tax=Folsomia candida TaxID=158441 RepID=A0A226EZ93_FOLCA|nr:Tyramine beta-hydroxylase [Folsomia candida]
MFRLLLRLSLLWAVAEAIFNLKLGEDTTLFWQLDYSTEEFMAEIHTNEIDSNIGWVGIGFSNAGNISDGSGIIWKSHLQAYSNKPLELTDVFVKNGTTQVDIDPQQDCKDFQFAINNGTLKWSFRRKFVTCDEKHDYPLEEGTTHLHWAKGAGPLFDIRGVDISAAKDSGFKRIRFLKNTIQPPPVNPAEDWSFKVLNNKVKIGPVETTYWCQVVRLPEALLKTKFHVVQFGSHVQKGNEELVHHMEVFHCLADVNVEIPLYAGPCDQSPKEIRVCSKVIGAWAMGAEPLTYPKEAGYPIGGTDFNPYVRLEMHYNNPALKSDWIDSSGMEFWVTEKLRKYDAGVIELGLEYTDKMAIPPSQEGFLLTGICNEECTSVGLPKKGIVIFASQLHTHLTGTRVVTRHYRPNMDPNEPNDDYLELPYLNWDNHYSTHYQEIRQLKGDVLLTTCQFQTRDRKGPTLGGFAISDEMCVNYVHYYPKSKLEVCKSSVSMKSLREYFHFMAEMEGQKISPDGPISSAYKGIEWTPFRAKLLSDFYNRSPVDMQCNQSDGSRFMGSWDAMAQPPFPTLPPAFDPNEECFLTSPVEVEKELLANVGNQQEQTPAQEFLANQIFHNRHD